MCQRTKRLKWDKLPPILPGMKSPNRPRASERAGFLPNKALPFGFPASGEAGPLGARRGLATSGRLRARGPAGSAGVKRFPRGPPRGRASRFAAVPPSAGDAPAFAQICPFPPPSPSTRHPQTSPSRGTGTRTSPGLGVQGRPRWERPSAMPFRKGRRRPRGASPGGGRETCGPGARAARGAAPGPEPGAGGRTPNLGAAGSPAAPRGPSPSASPL